MRRAPVGPMPKKHACNVAWRMARVQVNYSKRVVYTNGAQNANRLQPAGNSGIRNNPKIEKRTSARLFTQSHSPTTQGRGGLAEEMQNIQY